MSGKDYLQIWYRAQAAIALFCVCVIAGWEVVHGLPYIRMFAVMGLILVLALVAEAVRLPRWLELSNRWLQCLAQPVIMVVVWAIMSREIIVRLQLPARGVMIMTMAYFVVMFAPLAGIVGGELKNVVARIFYPFWWFAILTSLLGAIYPEKFAGPQFFVLLIGTGALGALAFFLMAVAAMRSWELSWPGIKPQFGRGFSWWSFCFLMVVALVFIALNALGGITSWSDLVATLGPHNLLSNHEYLLSAFEAGVAEETLCRFVILGALLVAFRNLAQQLPLAVVASALLFALMHLGNMLAQPVSTTLLQVLGTFGLGLFFAVVYLYTGQLWLAMLLHFLLDWTAFAASGSTTMNTVPTTSEWIAVGVEVVVFIGITVWMLTGDRRLVVDRHARRLTGADQHFGYRLSFD